MISEELKDRTKAVHAGLEKKLVGQIKNVKSISDYIQLLKLMYGYYQPLHDRINRNTPDINANTRPVSTILKDIKDLAPDEHLDFELCEDLPDLHTQAASLGALYVTEGSALGGAIITKMIAARLNIPTDRGFSFFNAYGNDGEKKWEEFKSIINEPRSSLEKQEIINSATATFEKFNTWITLYE